MRRLFIVVIACGAVLSLSAHTDGHSGSPDRDLSGVYACSGVRPDGVAYAGTVDIVRHAGTYQIRWVMAPNDQYLGIGLAADDTLAVSYFSGPPGVVLYRVERNEGVLRLVGAWTSVHADGRVFTETLTRVAETSGELHFKVVPRWNTAGRGRPGV